MLALAAFLFVLVAADHCPIPHGQRGEMALASGHGPIQQDLGQYDACMSLVNTQYCVAVVVDRGGPKGFAFTLAATCVTVLVALTVVGTSQAYRSPVAKPHADENPSDAPAASPAPLWQRVCVCWDLRANWAALADTSTHNSATACLHGVRVASAVGITVLHAWKLMVIAGVTNPEELLPPTGALSNYWFQLGAVAPTFCVDTFLLMTAFLLALGASRKLAAGRRLNALSMMTHRYVRLTPVYAATILLVVGLTPHMASGPIWFSHLNDVQLCAESWWQNLLYISNIPLQDEPKSICLIWSWYLSVEMQLCVFGLFFLYWYQRSRTTAVWMAVSTGSASVLACLYFSYTEKRFMLDDFNGAERQDYYQFMYQNPLFRLPPYAMGLVLGIAWGAHQDSLGKAAAQRTTLDPSRTSRAASESGASASDDPGSEGVQCAGKDDTQAGAAIAATCSTTSDWLGRWVRSTAAHPCLHFLLGAAVCLFVASVPAHYHTDTVSPWSDAALATYTAFSRPLWTLGVVLMLASWFLQPSQLLARLFGAPFWLPFSRLSYAAYLLHPVFLQLSYRSAREVAHYSTSALAYNSTHALLFGNSAAAVMYLLVELPTQKLEVEFLPRE